MPARLRASGRCTFWRANRDAPARPGPRRRRARASKLGLHPSARACRRGRRPHTTEGGTASPSITVRARAHDTLGHHSMTKSPEDPVQLARSATRDVFEVLLAIMNNPKATHATRLSAALALWDRGWFKSQPDESGKADERPVSELTTAELLGRASALIERNAAILASLGVGAAGQRAKRRRSSTRSTRSVSSASCSTACSSRQSRARTQSGGATAGRRRAPARGAGRPCENLRARTYGVWGEGARSP
jgi:hypothetical protein